MAEEKSPQSNNSSTSTSNSFSKGLMKDFNETFIAEGLYTHARNAVNNSHDGQVGTIGNEPANLQCVNLPYTLIGAIHLLEDEWAIYTTNDVSSEIGIFDESACTYKRVINDDCLNFKRSNPITGSFRKRYDCERLVYWEDGLNPSRTMDLDRVPFIVKKKVVNDCVVETPTKDLDCEAIRLASLITYPCIILEKGRASGTLPNGSYQVALAYTINQVRVTDYIGLTEVQSLFTHENTSSSLQVTITKIDKDFEEFELVILARFNAQTVAKRIGFYSTNQGTIYIDRIDSEAINVPIQDIILRTEPIEKADSMYQVGDYLLRVGVYSKFKFNYQIQANKIKTKWVATQYNADYYSKGGNNTSYMRDEQYCFFIRWIYNTGDRSDSYHIPGRKATSKELSGYSGEDAYELKDGIKIKEWQVRNTASVTNTTEYILPDGGKVIAKGNMGYWESTERYPDNTPEIWGNLCGKPIRHHKMPDETVDPVLATYTNNGNNIILLGVEFDNITVPLDNNGNPITSIVGYEILRSSREGNKTILAKGLFNNMREYPVPAETDIKGLYVNYPFNDLRPDSYLTSDPQLGNNGKVKPSSSKLRVYKKDYFSFHSPDVSFTYPYLNGSEVKLYQEAYGQSRGRFELPYRHPRFKLPSNFSNIISTIIGYAIEISTLAGAVGGILDLQLTGTSDIPITRGLLAGYRQDVVGGILVAGSGTIDNIANPASATRVGLNTTLKAINVAMLAALLPITGKTTSEQMLRIILGFIPKRNYAAQYNSYGFYNQSTSVKEGNIRRKLLDAKYVSNALQSFDQNYQINNVYRTKTVVVKLDGEFEDPSVQDTSRFTLSEQGLGLSTNVTSNISSYYGAMKIALPSQYGQLDSIKQFPISQCIEDVIPDKTLIYKSAVYFGGDVYINRFTEKNSMFFFDTWLQDEPDLYEIDYTLYNNLPYPRFWVNTTQNHSEYISLANQFRSLDKLKKGLFFVREGWFYLFNSGVRDFFVESEINLAYRDWEDVTNKRHYDPYRFISIDAMFRSDVIKDGNFYKYDYSLSISKLFNSSISWGNILPRDYDPVVASTCYTYRSNRLIYSLPQQDQSKKDSWRSFLSNNYKDFLSPITSIKPINKTGAIFMMKRQSPLMFMGTESLSLDATGTKVTVGDGALFGDARQLQAVVNADDSYEYGSCQSRYSAIGTKYGVFWVSQEQGKIFNYSGELVEISNAGMKWWFSRFLPSQLLKAFPNYKYFDNPMYGVGVQTIYDNVNEIVYFTKKDYTPILNNLQYAPEEGFYIPNGRSKIYYNLNDQTAFRESSWTISYDPKTKTWISFHDWHPTFLLPSKTHFMSVNVNSIWKHNQRCDLFCNFYGVDYPWEVEYVSTTGQVVTTMRNLEYILEAYKYHNDCSDKFHVLDRNFDNAIVYNSEQISGLLYMQIKEKNNPIANLQYPIVSSDYITIQYSKEENKYRFNQFWDITRNRGEYIPSASAGPVNIPMFNTDSNGYTFEINPLYVNYNKDPLEHKKFRHQVNRVFLRRNNSYDVKFLFKVSNQKLLPSYR
jgi:hypothetical protein